MSSKCIFCQRYILVLRVLQFYASVRHNARWTAYQRRVVLGMRVHGGGTRPPQIFEKFTLWTRRVTIKTNIFCCVLDISFNFEQNNGTVGIIQTFCTLKVRHVRCKPKLLPKYFSTFAWFERLVTHIIVVLRGQWRGHNSPRSVWPKVVSGNRSNELLSL